MSDGKCRYENCYGRLEHRSNLRPNRTPRYTERPLRQTDYTHLCKKCGRAYILEDGSQAVRHPQNAPFYSEMIA